MLTVNLSTIIYIVCPANYATGGPELLHQFFYKLKQQNYTVKMVYIPIDYSSPVHPQYKIYDPEYTNHIIDDASNIIIIPETFVSVLLDNQFRLKKIRKVIWWLSVDNYFVALNEKIAIEKRKKFFRLKKWIGLYKFADLEYIRNIHPFHLVQSHYASYFLKANNFKVGAFLSDYLNPIFFDEYDQSINYIKEDIIFYNPKKGLEFTQKLINAAPNLKWVPLENLTPKQILETLRTGKVYIDFGNHPGKDRLPREAALSGCCIITGKRGSARFYEDISIEEKFKFDEKSVPIEKIIVQIEDCLNNYEIAIKLFADYRKKILNEERAFEEDVKNIFIRV